MMSTELSKRINLHQLWNASLGKTGTMLLEEDLDFSDEKLNGLELMGAEIPAAIFRNSALRRADFTHCLLASADFEGCDMSGSVLRKTNLDYANLKRANLYGANLIRASCCEASLSGADLTGADLGRACFRQADLTDVVMVDCDVSLTLFEMTKLSGARVRGLIGFEEARIESIDVGVVLKGDEARDWFRTAGFA